MVLIRFGGRAGCAGLVSSLVVEQSLQAFGGVEIRGRGCPAGVQDGLMQADAAM